MLNKAILMGRLTSDPDYRQTPSGTSVATFSLAVDRNYTKAGSERQTDFINIVAWRSTADFVSKYFVKGQLVAVEGSIQTRNYTDKDGNKRYVTEVVADQVYFAESKRSGSPAAAADPFANMTPAPTSNTPYSQNTSAFQDDQLSGYANMDFSGEDDLPF